MALRIKCSCGKVILISSKLAGIKLACAACGKHFTISKERFEAVPPPAAPPGPKAARAQEHPNSSPTTGAASSKASPISADFDSDPVGAPTAAKSSMKKLDDEPVDFDLDSAIADLSGSLVDDLPARPDDELKLADEEPPKLELDPVQTFSPQSAAEGESTETGAVELSYARDGSLRPSTSRGSSRDVIQSPTRTFWADAFHSFVYPFANVNNCVTFAVICLVSLVRIPLNYAGILGLMGILFIYGWFCSLYLSIVQDTAVASEDLPGIKMEDGPIDDILKPMLKYLGASASALAPAVAYTILLATDLLPDWMSSGLALVAWICLGLFLLPVFILLFAFNALDMIYRVDLIITTVYRTLSAYMVIWLMLLLVGFTWTIPLAIELLAEFDVDVSLPSLPFDGLGFKVFMNLLDVYLTIISMRLIGLYYLHFKRRFTLVFE